MDECLQSSGAAASVHGARIRLLADYTAEGWMPSVTYML